MTSFDLIRTIIKSRLSNDLKDFKNLKVTDELNAAQKSATGLGDEVKLCSLIIDAKDTSIKVYREYPEYSFSTLVSDIGGSGIWFLSQYTVYCIQYTV